MNLRNFLFRRVNFSILITRQKNILVVADHNNSSLKSFTNNVITAAKCLGGDINVLVAGSHCSPAAKPLAKSTACKQVLVADNDLLDGFQEENIAELILGLQNKYSFSHIVAGASRLGKSVIPRVAARLDVNAITDVVGIKSADTFVRPIYANSALVTLKVNDPVKVITVREGCFAPYELREAIDDNLISKLERISKIVNINRILAQKQKRKLKEYARIRTLNEALENWKIKTENERLIEVPTKDYNLSSKVITRKSIEDCNRQNLLESKIIICGGRGLKSAKNFKLLFELAKVLNGAVGATGGAVDAGFAPRHLEIGQNGLIVAPDLFIAAGVSGKSQHLVGMRNSKIIVAINKDYHAPIYEIADYCLVANLFKVLPQIIKSIRTNL